MKSTKTLQEKIEVMQHYLNGGKITINEELWGLKWPPLFNWEHSDYSIYEEPKTKPSINWEHVHKGFKYMASDPDGVTMLYTNRPYTNFNEDFWQFNSGAIVMALAFTSFTPGTCDWKDSLVVRPE